MIFKSLSRSEENMLAPKSSPHRDYRDRDVPHRDRDMNRPRSALAHDSYRAHGGSTRSLTGSRDHLPSRSRSRPMSTDLDQLAEEFENVSIDKKQRFVHVKFGSGIQGSLNQSGENLGPWIPVRGKE